uniref:Homeobox domain-containing protein n=1 Tax=Caenorhabditis tropicalis TaxID=1561998 RepID=A0A1I7UVQ4_9PELO
MDNIQPLGELNMQENSIVTPTSLNLPCLIDNVCRDLIEYGSVADRVKLERILVKLYPLKNLRDVQLSAKMQAVIRFVDEDYEKSRCIIENSYFDEEHHSFLQDLFRRIWGKMTKKRVRVLDFIPFPASIDTIGKDNLPKSVSDYLYTYYITKRAEKKALEIPSVARDTGLSEKFITERFQMHREKLNKAGRLANKSEKKVTKGPSQKNAPNQSGFKESQNYHQYQYMHGSLTADYCRFPLTRVPLNEPLTIEIPEDFPTYFPRF